MFAKLSSSKSSQVASNKGDAPVQTEQEVFWHEYIDDSQKAKLAELRAALEAKGVLMEGTHLGTDLALLRYLKARQWDVAKAEKMYTDMVAWRKEYQTDAALESFHYSEREAVLAVYPQYYSGTDRWGRPVYIEKTGKVNYSALTKVTTIDRLVRFHVHCYESLVRDKFPACSKAADREIFTTTTILDLEGLSLSQFYKCKDALQLISKIDQDYYPEHLGAMIIINAPKMFTTVWNIIKPWLDYQTTSKIQILSKDFKEALLEAIPEENVPVYYGGKSTVPAGQSFGPWMDEKFSSGANRGL